MTVLSRFAGFGLLPLFSMLSPFLLLPVVARISDSATWASYTAGQTIGTLASAIVLWGWNISGPALIVQARTGAAQAELYRASLSSRTVVFLLVAPLACLLSAVIVPAPIDAMVMTLAMTLGGLSPGWFSIATGRPGIATVYDAVPRAIAVLVSVPLLLVFRFVWIYPLVLTLLLVGALIVLSRKTVPGRRRGTSLRVIGARLRDQAASAMSIALGSVYGAAPVPIATGTLSLAQASSFATVFQIYRFATFPILTLGNAFQSWVLGEEDRPIRRRQSAALVSHAVVGGVSAILFGVLGPTSSAILFGPNHRAQADLCWVFGLAIFFLSLNTPLTRNLLFPAGKHRIFLVATLLSSIVGMGVMLVSAWHNIPSGIAMGFSLSEFIVFAIVCGPALNVARKGKRWGE